MKQKSRFKFLPWPGLKHGPRSLMAANMTTRLWRTPSAARLIAWLPHTSHISVFMFDHLHWLPLIARIQLKVLTLIYRSHWSRSQVFTWPYLLAFLCHLSSSATVTWPPRSLSPTSEYFYSSDMSLCNHWSCTLEPTPSFYTTHFINRWAKCLFLFSEDCSPLYGFSRTGSASDWSALQEALYKCIDTIQYNEYNVL